MPLSPVTKFRRATTELLEAAVIIERESQSPAIQKHRIDKPFTNALKALSQIHHFTHLTH